VIVLPEPLPVRSAIRDRRRSIALVFGCTVLGAGAQALIKSAAGGLENPTLIGIITNLTLLGGLSLYGLSTILLVAALRRGELSLLYPVISLTFVWVTVLSVTLFHERINVFKLLGIGVIMVGVAVLGRDGES
jgi:drug/metabolite transporter (DMT)-like permease